MKLVIVESPAKAKTINRYLGEGYKVLASYGHVCDLPPKDGSVLPDENFEMKWDVPARSKKHVQAISSALKSADSLILATDPDREGEAISWHVYEILKDKKVLSDKSVKRVVFNEITKNAITRAMESPRDLDTGLINAYLARRALDYLVGFSLSPVLWRKLPGSRSAGRVQSVALRLICEREAEVEAFDAKEFWTIEAELGKADGRNFMARLTHLGEKKLGKLDIDNETAAQAAAASVEAEALSVGEITTKRIRENPKPPFTTSTLQQEASRKLGFSASRTMRVAQRLYEGINLGSETTGLITYMRTDGVQLANEALAAVREQIGHRFGNKYLPDTPRAYKSKAANAQEAHEAIRPTDLNRHPDQLQGALEHDQFRLYDLIWKRTIASQMESAELDQTGIDIVSRSGKVTLRTSGRVVVFDGYRKAYQEGYDTTAEDAEMNSGRKEDGGDDADEKAILPPMEKGEKIATRKVMPEQHFTQPPPRFTDATLVKSMEELGIGRPSTYASIIQVLQDREYVIKDGRRFIPDDRGRIVSTFLNNFFARYVEYDFTAKLEDQLDDVSDGKLEWRVLLKNFWGDFKAAIDSTSELRITNVIDVLDAELAPHFFPKDDKGELLRGCSNCKDGTIGLKLGKYGAFMGCSNYPECKYTRELVVTARGEADKGMVGDKHLGDDPENKSPIYLRTGPYGPYVQRGAPEEKKPKRSSLLKDMIPAEVDLKAALKLLELPRDIAPHPETGDMIQAGLGRFGPYLKYQGFFTSLRGDDHVLEVGINRAVELLAISAKKRGRVLGQHPAGGDVHVKNGRWGPYVEHNKLRANLPKDTEMPEVKLEEALELLARKAAGGGPKRSKAAGGGAKRGRAKKKAAS